MSSVDFSILNNMLKYNSAYLKLYIVGSYALQMYGIRETINGIDAYWERNEEIDRILNKFNETIDLKINDEIRAINDPVFQFNKDLYLLFEKYSNLEIYIPDKKYLVVMKVVSASIDSNATKHINDIIKLANNMRFQNNFNKIYDFFREYGFDIYGIKPIIDYLN